MIIISAMDDIGEGAGDPRFPEVLYWVEPVTFLGGRFDLVTASVDGDVVFCALKKPAFQGDSVSPAPKREFGEHGQYGEYLDDLAISLRHAGKIRLTPGYSANHETLRQLLEYLGGHRRDFELRLRLFGTVFQQAVWRELLAIPYGETRCYTDIACAVGSPRGARAVGMANNRNPVSLIVPCHRVIGRDGRLVGYGGGLDVKEKLLALEQSAGLERDAGLKQGTGLEQGAGLERGASGRGSGPERG